MRYVLYTGSVAHFYTDVLYLTFYFQLVPGHPIISSAGNREINLPKIDGLPISGKSESFGRRGPVDWREKVGNLG